MKRIIGWTLTILGGFFCIVCIVCIPAAFAAKDISILERFLYLLFYAALALGCALLCRKGIKLKSPKTAAEERHPQTPTPPAKPWMTSQFPALYVKGKKPVYRDTYLEKLDSIGFTKEEAEKLFQFECAVIQKYGKPFLLDAKFTRNWFFNLKQPFFQSFPCSKEDILKEKSLTISELCKLIDEAEWHYWNSHEKKLSDPVWTEICEWRLKGPGADFAIRYFEKVAEETGIPMERLASLSAQQGSHLNRYKWQ